MSSTSEKLGNSSLCLQLPGKVARHTALPYGDDLPDTTRRDEIERGGDMYREREREREAQTAKMDILRRIKGQGSCPGCQPITGAKTSLE